MPARWSALLVWALVLASALFWAYTIRGFARLAVVPAPAVPIPAAAPGHLARLFGEDETPPPQVVAELPPPADDRMQLIGVVSTTSEQDTDEGVALIAIDGKPALAYRVGMIVEGDTVLQAVEPRGARLGLRGGVTSVALSIVPIPQSSAGLASPAPTYGAPPAPVAAAPVQVVPFPAAAAPPPSDGSPPPFGGPPPAVGSTEPARTPTRRRVQSAER